MANKIFLDTNVLIDYVQERKYELDAIIEIFKLGDIGKIDLYISETTVTTSCYVLGKQKIDALSLFRDLCKTVNIVPFSKDILYFPIENYNDTEDGILYFLALKAKMNYFITRNVKDFTFLFPSLPVMSPTNFLKELYYNDLP